MSAPSGYGGRQAQLDFGRGPAAQGVQNTFPPPQGQTQVPNYNPTPPVSQAPPSPPPQTQGSVPAAGRPATIPARGRAEKVQQANQGAPMIPSQVGSGGRRAAPQVQANRVMVQAAKVGTGPTAATTGQKVPGQGFGTPTTPNRRDKPVGI